MASLFGSVADTQISDQNNIYNQTALGRGEKDDGYLPTDLDALVFSFCIIQNNFSKLKQVDPFWLKWTYPKEMSGGGIKHANPWIPLLTGNEMSCSYIKNGA